MRAMKPATEQVATPARNAPARLAKRRDRLVLMRSLEKNWRSEADDRALIAESEAEISAVSKAEPEISEERR
ncbi:MULTISPECIES: hypothetical protein [unclassified Bradyrhizobium]|uniref:hypothetical protein n=1 Tax=unclassified Bradyrhizobium TaxID=2631580 RepID=UPI001FFBAB57|nr:MULTISPECIES: hypothetical protein [unclassified Bradyrhizobium]MCK1535447.1 hypothetical protein [Bradyrhizobium sp. 176]MCK1558124.1 hypothetical protein [Bradyrhizobium sp. 171]